MADQARAFSSAGPASRELYAKLVSAIAPLGEFREEVKKTSVHLVRRSAFLGVHPRKEYLVVTIKFDKPIRSPRISKLERVSKGRWHAETRLTAEHEIDKELLGWIREAYALCA